MSPEEETDLWGLILAAFWAFASALVLGIDGPEEWSRGAWLWAASFAAASLVAAHYFLRLL